MKTFPTLRSAIALGTLTLLGSASATAHAQMITSYSGDAYSIYQDISSNQTAYGEAGPLPPAGGSQSASLANFTDPFVGGFTVGVGNAMTSGGGGVADSSATVSSISALFGEITVDAVTVSTHADVSGVSASSSVTGLSILGTPITVTGAPNQTVDLTPFFGFGSLVINEQVDTSTPGHNEITANALDFFVTGFFAYNIGHANSDVSFQPNASVPEPGSVALLVGFMTVGAGVLRRRRK